MLGGIKDSANITLISNTTNKQVLYADYANKVEISFSSSPVYATKKGVNAISWDGQKEASLTTSMQVFDLKWIALLFGTEFNAATSTDRIAERKVLTVSNASASFDDVIVTGSLTVFKLESDSITQGEEYTVTTESTVPAGKYKIVSNTSGDVTTNTITFPSGETGKFVVYYLKAASTTNKKFTVSSDSYPSGYTMYMDTQYRNDSGVDSFVQMKLPYVKPQQNVTLTFDAENVCNLDISWDLLPDSSNTMLEFTQL